jgi:quinol monooxygenase YgiN
MATRRRSRPDQLPGATAFDCDTDTELIDWDAAIIAEDRDILAFPMGSGSNPSLSAKFPPFECRKSQSRGLNPMLTITAVIRTKQGCDQVMRDALLEVAANVRANEPDTIDFFVSQDINDPCVFTTYERFTDQAAMDRHNNSDVVARFFGIAKPILDGDVTLVTSSELFAKS